MNSVAQGAGRVRRRFDSERKLCDMDTIRVRHRSASSCKINAQFMDAMHFFQQAQKRYTAVHEKVAG
jgi:hypothetical protein